MSTIDQKTLRAREALCTQEQPPKCMAWCPLHLDGRALALAVAKGDFSAGRTLLEKAVVFPRIIARLCDAPCRAVCRRGDVGEAIHLQALEEACMVYGEQKSTGRVFRPKKSQRVLVVGDTLCGLSNAVELAKKGYQVIVWADGKGLWDELATFVPDQISKEEVERDLAVLGELGIVVEKGQVVNHEVLGDYDGVFLGGDMAHSGINTDSAFDPLTLQTAMPQVFARVVAEHFSVVDEMAMGKRGAISLDRYLQHVSLTVGRENEGAFVTTLITDINGVASSDQVPYRLGYSEVEAQDEANRCLNCQCLACVAGCGYLAHYKSYPKKYVREVYNNLSIVMGNHFSNTMINACSLCGQCKAICPYDFDMGDVCKSARETMVQTGKMPPSTHEFALLDQAFSNGEEYALAKHQAGYDTSAYVFFPGCQMGASSPEIVLAAYEDLTRRLSGGVGLILGCCGAIADWAGQEKLFAEGLAQTLGAWEALGRPKVITACPTCYQIFTKHTEMEVCGIIEILESIGLPEGVVQGQGILAVHDACTARYSATWQDGVRRLASGLGYQLQELPFSKETTPCCGFGGLTDYASREVGREMVAKCIGQSDQDYLTYCVNCRDRFVAGGKSAWHVLELVYGERSKSSPGISVRRYNRVNLKNTLLRDYWGEERMEEISGVNLIIAESVQSLLEERLILASDLVQVLQNAEETNQVMMDQETGYLTTYHRLGNVTFWVTYSKVAEGYRVHDAYSHRMEIEEV